ncbi:DUF2188 domain-containing protein [Aquimarina sp. ERC-38]|uniref:DUF2188 domain-containing protein n=1 Tax=Aquimarina sp. ERC-38 TaxID=2949996 RepID=UPI0022455922|nr:DUF2188 domain-containing protein [Aquimarina sp. ERC-38]UZO82077.1 DUF2188 domain-containing protein [Aquimarina sp. ERC-38]
MYNISEERIKILSNKFEEAGASYGKKLHVISQNGQWVLFKDGSDRIISRFSDKKSAVSNGKKLLNNTLPTLVIHRTDGTVERLQKAS